MRRERQKTIERRKAKDHRTRFVNVRFTPAEYESLKGKADAVGMTISTFLRDYAGRVRITRRTERRELLLAVARVGSNVNQLARWANRYKTGVDSVRLQLRLVEIAAELRRLTVADRSEDEPGGEAP
jgi:hypothetical protein